MQKLLIALVGATFISANAYAAPTTTATASCKTNPVAVLTTNMGTMEIQLNSQKAPVSTKNFISYVNSGFYNGKIFHRVIDGFMAQGGCPDGTGMGGSSKPDLVQEFNAEPHVRGVCSMARAMDPNSANSQFFICLDDATFLDRQYTAWGVVESGMEHVDALPKGEPPANPGLIHKATVG